MNDLKLYGKSKEYLETLMNTVRIFTNNIKMKLSTSKCASLFMRSGRKMEDNGIQMPGEIAIVDRCDEAYKYRGIQGSDKIKTEEKI